MKINTGTAGGMVKRNNRSTGTGKMYRDGGNCSMTAEINCWIIYLECLREQRKYFNGNGKTLEVRQRKIGTIQKGITSNINTGRW